MTSFETQVDRFPLGSAQRQVLLDALRDPDELPDPPDNFDLWNSFPEAFRERVTNQFTRGIDREYNLIRDRVQSEYAVARARQTDREKRQARRAEGGRR